MKLELTNEDLTPIVREVVREIVIRELGEAIRAESRDLARRLCRWITPKRAGRFVGISERTLREYVQVGEVTKSVGLGVKEPRLLADDLVEILEEKQIKSARTLAREKKIKPIEKAA